MGLPVSRARVGLGRGLQVGQQLSPRSPNQPLTDSITTLPTRSTKILPPSSSHPPDSLEPASPAFPLIPFLPTPILLKFKDNRSEEAIPRSAPSTRPPLKSSQSTASQASLKRPGILSGPQVPLTQAALSSGSRRPRGASQVPRSLRKEPTLLYTTRNDA